MQRQKVKWDHSCLREEGKEERKVSYSLTPPE